MFPPNAVQQLWSKPKKVSWHVAICRVCYFHEWNVNKLQTWEAILQHMFWARISRYQHLVSFRELLLNDWNAPCGMT